MLIEKESLPKSKNENIEPIVSDDQPTILKSAGINILSSETCPDILSGDKSKAFKGTALKTLKVTSPLSETSPAKIVMPMKS